jgi:broad specificity phosphatase PhoE
MGEGQRYDVRREPDLSLADHFAKGKFPPLRGRTERFPEGESLEDVAARAEEAIAQLGVPYIRKAAREGTDGMHIAFVSHGLFIGEAIAALMRKDKRNAEGINARDYRGLRNTGWTRVIVLVKVRDTCHPYALQAKWSRLRM